MCLRRDSSKQFTWSVIAEVSFTCKRNMSQSMFSRERSRLCFARNIGLSFIKYLEHILDCDAMCEIMCGPLNKTLCVQNTLMHAAPSKGENQASDEHLLPD